MMQQMSFPFVVEPPSPLRVQMWAWFAGRAATREAYDIVTDVYHGFWWNNAAYEEYEEAVEAWQEGCLHRVVTWLNNMLGSLCYEREKWCRVASKLEGNREQFAGWESCFADVGEHVGRLSGLVEQVASQIVMLCEQEGYEVPRFTQGYLLEQVATH